MRHVAPLKWQAAYDLIEPQINAAGVHVFPFRPEFPIDVRFLNFTEHAGIRSNRHDYYELLFVHSGAVVYQVQDRQFRLAEGDLFVMGSIMMHRMCQYPLRKLKAAVLYFHPDLIRGNGSNGAEIEYLMPFLVQDELFPHVVKASTGIPAQVLDLMRRAAAELPAQSNRARLSVETYLKMTLVLLVNHYADYKSGEDIFLRKQRDLHKLQPVFKYIDENYASSITVQGAARQVHMSKSSFMRFFKRVTGESFITYVNHFRISRAQSLMLTTDQSIAEISQEVGFCDQSYFGLLFRKLTGHTPREYKNTLENRIRATA